MNENTAGKILKQLPHKTREKLRRAVLVSQDDDNTIAEKVGCVSFHVKAMRDRLIALGVLVRPTIDPPPPRRRVRVSNSKYRNGDLFDDAG